MPEYTVRQDGTISTDRGQTSVVKGQKIELTEDERAANAEVFSVPPDVEKPKKPSKAKKGQ